MPDNDIDFGIYMGAAARALLGKPNQQLSSATDLRFGTNGSLSVKIAGESRGTWYDHEAKVGGGVLDFIQRETGLVNGAAMQWLRDECGANFGEPLAHHGGVDTRPARMQVAKAIRVPEPREEKAPVERKLVATFDYTDAAGTLIFQVLRFEPKTFRQRRPDGKGGWAWSVKGLELVPYRAVDLAASGDGAMVFAGEGEKVVDALRGIGVLATCNPMGAGKWWPELTPFFAGKDVVLLPDNDEAGRKHVELVAAAIQAVARRVRVLELPGLEAKGDAADWIAAGGDAEELLALADAAPDWQAPLTIWDRIHSVAPHSPSLKRLVDGDFSHMRQDRAHLRDLALGTALKRAGFCYLDMRQALLEWTHGRGAEALEDGNDRYFEGIWDKAGGAVPDHVPLPNEEPLPLRRDMRPALTFPVEHLPKELREAAEVIQAKTQAPMSICAQSVIAAASLAAQQHADIVLPMGSRKPLSLYCITVAESGERKSGVDDLAAQPIKRWQEELREIQDAEMPVWWREMEAYKAAREGILRDKAMKGNRKAISDALEEVGAEPVRPLASMIIADNLTVEGIERYFIDNGQPSIGLFTAEGGKIIGGHMMSEENRMKAGATLNILWDGTPMNRVRSGDGTHTMLGRRVAVHIMVQPTVVDGLFGDPTLNSLGTLARMLIVAPETTAGTRFWREVDPKHNVALQRYSDALLELLRLKPMHGAKKCELAPRALHLTPKARELWISFHDEVEGKLKPSGPYAPIRPFGSKLAEHAARLAGVMAMLEDPFCTEVGEGAMQTGVLLALHYAEEALRLLETGMGNPDLVLAERLLTWLREAKVERFHLPMVYREGPSTIRNKDDAQRVVSVLEKHGWVRRLPRGTEVAGKPRDQSWEVFRPARGRVGMEA